MGICIPLLSLGPVARAAPPSKEPASRKSTEFQTYLQAALRMYESLDYELALEKLARAKSYVRNLEDDALVSFYEGIILADMNRREQSRTAFRAGLLLKPDAQLPMKVSPKVEQDFEAVRAEVQRELGSLQAEQETQKPAEVLPEPPPPPARVEAPAPAIVAAPRPRSNGLSYALLGGGAAVAGTGVFLGLSGLSYNERKKDMTIDEAVKARATAGTQLSAGTVLLGAGLVALGTGTALLLLPRGEPGTPTASLLISPLPGGFALGSAGRF